MNVRNIAIAKGIIVAPGYFKICVIRNPNEFSIVRTTSFYITYFLNLCHKGFSISILINVIIPITIGINIPFYRYLYIFLLVSRSISSYGDPISFETTNLKI